MFYLKKYFKFILIGVVSVIIICSYFIINRLMDDNNSNTDNIVAFVETSETITSSEEIPTSGNCFYVDVKGEVKKPGVYFVSEGMLVIDAINLAGGLTKNAYTNDINLSLKLYKEMVIFVNNKNKITTTVSVKDLNDASIVKNDESTSTSSENKLININTASKEELMSLSGIGESKANSIIEYRKTNKFETIEDIKKVSGIGDKFFEQIKDFITV